MEPPIDLSNNFSPKFGFEEKSNVNSLKNNIIETYNSNNKINKEISYNKGNAGSIKEKQIDKIPGLGTGLQVDNNNSYYLIQ